MKKAKNLKSYIIKNYIIFSVAIMITSNILETVMAKVIEKIKDHFHLLETDLFSTVKPEAKYYFILVVVIYVLLQILVFYFFIKIFERNINRRIAIPVDKLTLGLKKIVQGDLSTRLDLETENEFVEMCNAFNYMALEMEKAQAAKKIYENERNLLFSNIAHDLKTPITTITGYSKALLEGMVTCEEKQMEYLYSIYGKSQQMNEMLGHLFSYTKLDNEQYILKYKKIDIIELIRSNAAIAYSDFEYNDIELAIDLPDEAVIISIDRFEMNRAISNLLSNAINHNPKGSKVLLKVENIDRLKIIIADNGSEISENIVKRLFDPFVLGDESRSSKGGSGLGLAITKKIIEKHNGEIYLDTNYQGYTKAFIIYLKKNC